MGLDMYLNKRTYVKQWDHIDSKDQYQVTVTRGGNTVADIKEDRVKYVIEEVAYWRKANQIHQWFVNHVQEGNDDCGEYEVSRTDIEELINTCKEVLQNPAKASIVLPTQDGFFYGSTEYDEGYFEDVQDTIKMLEPLLLEERGDYYYQSSW